MIREFSDIYSRLKNEKPKKAVIAAADDEDVLSAVKEAEEKELIIPILVGNKDKILSVLEKTDYAFKGRIIDIDDNTVIAETAVRIISSSEADILVKGLFPLPLF